MTEFSTFEIRKGEHSAWRADETWPGWLTPSDTFAILQKDGGFFGPVNIFQCRFTYGTLRLPIDHWALPAIERNMRPHTGSETAPNDWDGEAVLLRNGDKYDGEPVWYHDAQVWYHDAQTETDIIGYGVRTEPAAADDGVVDAVVRQLVEDGRAKHRTLNAEQQDAADSEAKAFYRKVIDRYPAALTPLGEPDNAPKLPTEGGVRKELHALSPFVQDIVVSFLRARNLLAPEPDVQFALGARVEKRSGAAWRGTIVGSYSTALTPRGWAVESENEPGSVQIYPEVALRILAAVKGAQ